VSVIRTGFSTTCISQYRHRLSD